MNRKKGILAAASLTGLVLITILALGFGSLGAKSGQAAAVDPSAAGVSAPQTGDMSSAEALQAWQSYSAELEQAVSIMQQRETTYRQQIDAANQTILQLQDQINSNNRAPAYDDDDRYEHEEYEHEEGEHEAYEHEYREAFDD